MNILLIEDDLEFVGYFKILFAQEQNFEAELFHMKNLKEAHEHLAKSAVDLILLDLWLPDSQGIENVVKLRESYPDIPLVVLTNLDDELMAVEAVRLGAQDYIVKGDFNIQVLIRTMRYAMERSRILQELKTSNDRLSTLSMTDTVTGVLNRFGLDQAITREVRQISRGKNAIVMLIDLDNFKSYNDLYGHHIGDKILKITAEQISTSLRSTSYVSRVGGDEFIVVLPETSMEDAYTIADRIRYKIGSVAKFIPELKDNVTASLGLARLSIDDLSIEKILARAHVSLKQSKSEGKNRISMAGGREESSGSLSVDREQLKDPRNYYVTTLPIVDLATGKAKSVELLSRSSIESMVMPQVFFEFARKSHLKSKVDSICMENCARKALETLREFTGLERFHVNIFPSTVLDSSFEHFVNLFQPLTLPGSWCLEMSGADMKGDIAPLAERLREIKRAGIRVCIEDIGFGHSSLESLFVFEPEFVKIDRRWVWGIANDLTQQKILRRFLSAVENLNCTVMAEGIEAEEDRDKLFEMGVRLGQGFLWKNLQAVL